MAAVFPARSGDAADRTPAAGESPNSGSHPEARSELVVRSALTAGSTRPVERGPLAPADEVHPHGEVAVAGGNELIPYNPDAPSEAWGWHGHFSDFAPRGRAAFLLVGVAGLFLMIWGNHVSHVEDYWLAAIAIILGVWAIRSQRARTKARRLKP